LSIQKFTTNRSGNDRGEWNPAPLRLGGEESMPDHHGIVTDTNTTCRLTVSCLNKCRISTVVEGEMDPSSASAEQSIGAKRKRTPIADSTLPPLTVVANGSAHPQINYLAKVRPERLKIIEGDAETFSDVLAMIDDYEGKLFTSVC